LTNIDYCAWEISRLCAGNFHLPDAIFNIHQLIFNSHQLANHCDANGPTFGFAEPTLCLTGTFGWASNRHHWIAIADHSVDSGSFNLRRFLSCTDGAAIGRMPQE